MRHIFYIKDKINQIFLLHFRKIFKKRREHEYKIRRRTKELKEYIEYIEVRKMDKLFINIFYFSQLSRNFQNYFFSV